VTEQIWTKILSGNTLDNIPRAIANEYNKIIESLIKQVTSDQILCVHTSSKGLSLDENDEYIITQNIEYHILNPGQFCRLPESADQYVRN
jgi:hypothetical protein